MLLKASWKTVLISLLIFYYFLAVNWNSLLDVGAKMQIGPIIRIVTILILKENENMMTKIPTKIPMDFIRKAMPVERPVCTISESDCNLLMISPVFLLS